MLLADKERIEKSSYTNRIAFFKNDNSILIIVLIRMIVKELQYEG